MLAKTHPGLHALRHLRPASWSSTSNIIRSSHQQTRTLLQASFDYKHIRDNAQRLLENAHSRNVRDAQPHRVGELYNEFRQLTSQVNEYRSSLNNISKELGALARGGKKHSQKQKQHQHQHQHQQQEKTQGNVDASGLDESGRAAVMADLHGRASIVKASIQGLELQLGSIEARLRYEAAKIPNLSHPDTPLGDESHARTVHINGNLHNTPTVPLDETNSALSDVEFKDHYDLALSLGIVDMEAGARVAGSRFHYWRGAGALLELALVQYAMTRAVAAGFVPHITPDVARSSVVDACGFRPRSGAEDALLDSQINGDSAAAVHGSGEASQIYRVMPVAEESHKEAAADPLCLVATAEIPLVAMRQQQILDRHSLPISMAGLSHCFRAEAGARGRDTRGIYRLHQFTKVELVTLALPENSQAELTRLVDFQKSLYADLGLTFRLLQMPTYELGASAYQKFDIEAWMPGRRAWGEISSASNCTDYQARRLGIRVRAESAKDGSGSPVFVHTLNATAVAVPRIVVA
ncbi:hypothetical protein GGF37_002562, partial [Kickxella alabastrina]